MTISIGRLSIVVHARGPESSEGTSVPAASMIVDATGSVWQLGAPRGDEREILVDGAPLIEDVTTGKPATAAELRYHDRAVYKRTAVPNSGGFWWWLYPPRVFSKDRMFDWTPIAHQGG